MLALLPKIFPGVVPLAVLLCALFAGRSAAHVFEQSYLADARQAERALAEALPPRSPAPTRSKDSRPLIERNMFCPACADATSPEPVERPGNATRLPLRLIATSLAEREERSFASIFNTQSLRHGAYQIGQTIPEAGVVESIGRDYLEFRGLDGNRLERVLFDSGTLSHRPPSKVMSSRGAPPSLAEEYVRILDPRHLEVDRDLIGKVQGNPRLAGARARPIAKDGHMNGVRLFAVRASGLAHSMGLRNGDKVLAANGVKLQSIEAGLELMGQLKVVDHWSIDIERKGKPVTLQVDLR